ncbi:MAG: HEPN domain-containing protein, partial [Armatimonadota bacterium]
MANRYVQSWMKQAEHDLETARTSFGADIYDACVIQCQQAVEKALKALHIAQHGELAPKTHSLERLAELTGMTDDLDASVYQLGKDYFELRYPDDAGRAPFERCTREHAEAALGAAEGALAVIRKRVAEAGESSSGSDPGGDDGLLPELPESPPQDISGSPGADPQIRRFAEKYLDRVKAMYGPLQLWVFGSRVRGEPYQCSDIDML